MEVQTPATMARRKTLGGIFPTAGEASNGAVGPNNDFRRPDEEEGPSHDSTFAWSSVMAANGRSSIPSAAVSNESFQQAYGGEWGQGLKFSARLEKLQLEIEAVGMEISRVEKSVLDAQTAAQHGSSYGGKQGDVLQTEEVRLVRKEEQLREEKKQLQEEKLVLLKAMSKTRGTGVKVARRGSRLKTWGDAAEDTRGSASEAGGVAGSIGSTEAERLRSEGIDGSPRRLVTTIKTEEDSRLITRLDSFSNPILVSTLVAGFCLVLFEVSELRVARQFALVSFALEISASFVLSGIAFHAQQLYSYSLFEVPKTRTFLHGMRPFTAFALAFSAIGMIAFMVAFILEASKILGHPWLVLVSVVLFPSLFAGATFISTIRVMRRLSMLSIMRANMSE